MLVGAGGGRGEDCYQFQGKVWFYRTNPVKPVPTLNILSVTLKKIPTVCKTPLRIEKEEENSKKEVGEKC